MKRNLKPTNINYKNPEVQDNVKIPDFVLIYTILSKWLDLYEITHDGCWVPLFIHFVIWLVVILAVTTIPTLLLDFLLGFLAAVVDTYVSSWGQNLHMKTNKVKWKSYKTFDSILTFP